MDSRKEKLEDDMDREQFIKILADAKLYDLTQGCSCLLYTSDAADDN